MIEPVRVGLIDSGVAENQEPAVAGAQGFSLDEQSRVSRQPAMMDQVMHGAVLAEIILAAAPRARLLNAQVFRNASPASPRVIAAALEWVVAEGARVVNMSFGLSQDRAVLREACAAAVATGVLLVAATPARGSRVFPACYEEIVRVCGDARCGPGELSILPDCPAHFGACPHPSGPSAARQRLGGASVSTAHLTGMLAAFCMTNPRASREVALRHLESLCRFHGRERRADGSMPPPSPSIKHAPP